MISTQVDLEMLQVRMLGTQESKDPTDVFSKKIFFLLKTRAACVP